MSDVTTERWLPVVGFEGFLEVSDQGRIHSLDRVSDVSASSDGTRPAYQRSFKGRILKPKSDPQGYLYVQLWGGGKCHNGAKVHRVVLEAFVGPCPDGMECCHANDIHDDNRLSNLRWDTQAANVADKMANGGTRKRTRCVNGHRYTPENTVIVEKRGTWHRRCKICRANSDQRSLQSQAFKRRTDPAWAENARRRERANKKLQHQRRVSA